MRRTIQAAAIGMLLSQTAIATDDLTLDAAIGGAIGGAVGGAIGAELGGREGAIVGAGVGAATGTAVNTRDYAGDPAAGDGRTGHQHSPKASKFCPPGQAKKGRC